VANIMLPNRKSWNVNLINMLFKYEVTAKVLETPLCSIDMEDGSLLR